MGFFEIKTKKTLPHSRSLIAACALCCNTDGKTKENKYKRCEVTKPIPVLSG